VIEAPVTTSVELRTATYHKHAHNFSDETFLCVF